jgi:hypothetical protein
MTITRYSRFSVCGTHCDLCCHSPSVRKTQIGPGKKSRKTQIDFLDFLFNLSARGEFFYGAGVIISLEAYGGICPGKPRHMHRLKIVSAMALPRLAECLLSKKYHARPPQIILSAVALSETWYNVTNLRSADDAFIVAESMEEGRIEICIEVYVLKYTELKYV